MALRPSPAAAIGLCSLLLAVGCSAFAASRDVGGVTYPEALPLGGQTLRLNGAGIRHKAVFKVYAAALYLPTQASTAEAVLAQPGPKRIAITMLRDIDANELGKLFTKGVEENSPRSEMVNLIPGLLRMGQMFADQKQLRTGDTFTIDWLPGTGTLITVRGVPQPEPVKEPAFYNALLRIWLGPSPADWKLKDALLGKP